MKSIKRTQPLKALIGVRAFPHEETGLMVLLLQVEDIDSNSAPPALLAPLLCSDHLLEQLEEALPIMREQLKRVRGAIN